VVASHGRDEEPVLAAALRAAVPYVGLVASRRRGAQVAAALGATAADTRRLHTPAGLDIGARTPEEIALSIFAEIISERLPVPDRAPGGTARGAASAMPGGGGPAQQATDPVCGMTVTVSHATPGLTHDGACGTSAGPDAGRRTPTTRRATSDNPPVPFG
jgi:xanthine dehydrogenase accessory factor